MRTIADIIRAGIAAGKNTNEILADVKAEHPGANTSAACVAYYRSKAKKAGDKVIAAAKEPKKTEAAKAVESATGKGGYEVRGIKTFNGMEGAGYNATLYRDGKKVAEVIDDASGGPLMFHWADVKDGTSKTTIRGYDGAPREVNCTKEEALLYKYTESLPDHVCSFEGKDGKPATLQMSPELFVEHLVNDTLLLRDLRRKMKGKVVFVHEGKLWTMKAEPTPANLQKVRDEYKGAVVLNDLDDEKLLGEANKIK